MELIPISWMTRRQCAVALSSTEAKYMALAQATREAVWLRRLLSDLGVPQSGPTTIFEDNQAAIAIAKNPVHHDRTKHIDIQFHFTREKIQEGVTDVRYCASGDQLADAFTKALPRHPHVKYVQTLLHTHPSAKHVP